MTAGVLLALHILSCGPFYSFRLPQVLELPREVYDDIRDIYILAGTQQGSCRCLQCSHTPQAAMYTSKQLVYSLCVLHSYMLRHLSSQNGVMLAGGPQHPTRLPKYEQPKLIPKIVHQTYKTSSVPAAMLPHMASWRQKNSDWNVRFYDDAACLRFVKREFPEYLKAYTSLRKDVERSDFFR